MKISSLLLVAAALPLAAANTAPLNPLDAVPRWNQIAIDASGLDHMPTGLGEPHIFGEQIGPCRAARAMAIVHIAMFDTANAPTRKYESFTGLRGPASGLSLKLAISQAAHDTLVALFPSQGARFDAFLAADLETVRSRAAKRRGVKLGQRVAERVLALRANDGSQHPEIPINAPGLCYVTSNQPGHWRQDPISRGAVALGARWHECLPFVLQSSAQFRVPPPPALDSAEYAVAYLETKLLGGDGVHTPTMRTDEQTEIGIYWAYDGTPSLCAPPRLYNQVALTIAQQQHSSGLEVARLLALVNVAMADAGMAVWDSKYHYDFWRPVTGIREADAATGPTGAGDGNEATGGDPNFHPLGAPARWDPLESTCRHASLSIL